MGKIIRIFTNDLKTVYTNIVALIVIIGIIILPALYSWFNIASNWDPYSSTGNVPFAVCNLDKGFEFQGIEVNAGAEIVDALKGNPKMGWDFVDGESARKGVDSGTYYAAVVIPEDFSENLTSITTGEFQQSSLEYFVNEKKNAIAPKITNAGVTTIESEVKTAYVNTVTKIIATALNLTAGELGGKKEDVLAKVKQALSEAQNSIDDFNSTADVFISTLDLLKKVLSDGKTSLPSLSNSLHNGAEMASDMQTSLSSAKSFSLTVSSALSEITSSVEDLQNSVSLRIDSAAAKVKADSAAAATELAGVTNLNRRIIHLNTTLLQILKKIEPYIIFDITPVTSQLENANLHQEELISRILSAGQTIGQAGAVPENSLKELRTLSDNAKAEIGHIRTAFEPVKAALDKAIDNMYDSLDNIVSVLSSLSESTPKAEGVIDSTMQTVDKMAKTFQDLRKMMSSSKDKLESLKRSAETVLSDQPLAEMVMKIISDPAALSDFFSQPVSTVTYSIHPVDNYGSGMAPFYTSLGIWVGSIVLCAVVRAELSEKQKKQLNAPNNTQQFFGRYLTYLLLSVLQGLVIALGDLYFLGIRCNDPLLFILGCVISAFVYSMIVYSLTVTFNVIGKALAVIILVLQVAGSGGTFPLEVLPAPFQAIAPFLPFRYGNDILREAIAGADLSVYLHNVLMLLAFVPFALFIGLLLRLPLIKFMHFFDRRIHRSDLIA